MEGLARREVAPTEAGPHIWHDPSVYVDADVVFRQLCCPGCLTAVHSRVVPVGHPLPPRRLPELGMTATTGATGPSTARRTSNAARGG
ncbi:hypothetical protein AB7952_00285 [Streptomyces sp. PG2]